ncbi:MAG: TonB-dependent receptor [Bryobacterales bacterium]|nr:TonB-dependent receptor [Bryobacterales bacterium]
MIRGTVHDSSKAVMPGAQVTISNTGTGTTRSTVSNEAGIYVIPSVAVGPYRMSVSASGFKKWESEFTLAAGQTLSIDPVLEVGSVENTMEVTGAAPTITTEGAQVGDIKDALRIHNLPLNGRQVTTLFDLTPGVVGGGNPRTNGMKVGATEMLLDGASMVDRFGGGMSRVQPGLDTVQEFRIETAASGAQFSRPATVSLVTRSGTNDFHGAAFETFRSNAAGLRSRARQDVRGDAAKLIRNEFGFFAGGPVLLPKIYNGKNRTFWFMDLEYLKQRQNSYAEASAFTPAMWNGDLSNMTDSSSNRYTIYDPLTTGADGARSPFPGNAIPGGRINNVAKVMQSISPVPNFNLDQNPWLTHNFRTYYPSITNTHSITFKGDHTISDKDTLSGRYTQSPRFSAVYGGVFGFPAVGCTDCGGSSRQNYMNYSATLRETHVFTPTLINELLLSFSRNAGDSGTLGDNVSWANKLGFPNPFGVTGWPSIYTDAGGFLYGGGWDGDNRKNQMLTAFNIEDNVTWVKGKHNLQMGFKGRLERNNIREMQQAQGSHSFYSAWTSLYDPLAQNSTPYTGSGFADLLMGLPASLNNQYNRGYFYFQQKELGLYFNDTWKVTPKLTLGLGLRWDHWTPYKEKYNRLATIDMNNPTAFQVISPYSTSIDQMPGVPSGVLDSWRIRGLSWTTAEQAGFPGALMDTAWKDFGPRLSLAYRINEKTVIRAGYGMYYWPMPLSQILQISRTSSPLNLVFSNNPVDRNGNVPNYALLNAPSSSDYMPNVQIDTTGIAGIPSTSRPMVVMDPKNWADDRMQQWTFNIEREIMKETSLRLSYIGTHGSNLEQRVGWNTPESAFNYMTRTGLNIKPGAAGNDLRRFNPNWNATLISHIGFSNSNSAQVEVQRRFAQGLSFQAFYVYNHALTTTDANGFGSGADGATVPENKTILGQPSLTMDQRLRLVYYNSAAIPPHQLKWNGVYDLPFGKGKKWGDGASKLVDSIIGGWQIAFIGYWQSGNWLNPANYVWSDPHLDSGQQMRFKYSGVDSILYFKGDFDPTLAKGVDQGRLQALVPLDRGQRAIHPVSSNGTAYNNQVQVKLADGSVVNAAVTDNFTWNPKNSILGPRAWSEDLSVFKYFNITERIKLRLTGDFFNAFNHPNNNNPNTTTGLINMSTQANDPRIIQLTGRIEW